MTHQTVETLDPQRTEDATDKSLFRDAIGRFIDREIRPHHADWERQGFTPKDVWLKAGAAGLLCPDVPTDYGGLGLQDYQYNLMILTELSGQHLTGADIATHSEMVVPYITYFGTEEQKHRWLPRMVSGDVIGAIALTEPNAGSDLVSVNCFAEKVEGGYRLNGQKTFINGGTIADAIIVGVRTRKDFPLGISLMIVERHFDGFESSPPQRKIGLHAQDTADLFFDNVFIPDENLIGRENAGFGYVMAVMRRERYVVGAQALASARAILNATIEYTKQREIRGQPLSQYQNTRFTFAKLKSKIDLGQSHVDALMPKILARKITDSESAMVKYWGTETYVETADRCLQLHGGYGYMQDFPISGQYLDARATTIYGGATEVMLEIIASDMRL